MSSKQVCSIATVMFIHYINLNYAACSFRFPYGPLFWCTFAMSCPLFTQDCEKHWFLLFVYCTLYKKDSWHTCGVQSKSKSYLHLESFDWENIFHQGIPSTYSFAVLNVIKRQIFVWKKFCLVVFNKRKKFSRI